jgi:hypothetical protein
MKDVRQTMKAVKLSLVLLETIDDLSGDDSMGGIPEGHAYMAFMGILDLDQFQGLLSGLKKTEAIKSNNHFLTKGKAFDKVVASFKNINETWERKLKEAGVTA